MDFLLLLGAVGSVASILAFALPPQNQHPRTVHAVYGFVIAVLSAVTVWYWSENNRVQSVERMADALVADSWSGYTDQGFIQASLAFLEKNRDLYPEAYSRAQNLCELNDCLVISSSTGNAALASAYLGLLKGIGTIESSRP